MGIPPDGVGEGSLGGAGGEAIGRGQSIETGVS